jgi:hypothetical protein
MLNFNDNKVTINIVIHITLIFILIIIAGTNDNIREFSPTISRLAGKPDCEG